jgi:hypothetical protein
MSLRSIQQLQDALDAERVWRVRELSILRKKLLTGIPKTLPVSEAELAMLRPCVTMLYGHWEGFVKSACSFYLEYVALQRLKQNEMQPQFLALSARKYASNFGLSGAEADRAMVDYIRNQPEARGGIPYKGGVDTKMNLWFDVFSEIYDSLGLSWHEYELKKHLIDTKLVSKRNAIAHGKYIDIEPIDVEELFDLIIALMDEIKEQLFDHARNRKFALLSEAEPV